MRITSLQDLKSEMDWALWQTPPYIHKVDVGLWDLMQAGVEQEKRSVASDLSIKVICGTEKYQEKLSVALTSISKSDLWCSDLSRIFGGIQFYQEKWSVAFRYIKKMICGIQIYQEKWSVAFRSIKKSDLSRSDLSWKVICHAQIYQEKWSVTLRSIKKNVLWRSDLYSPLGVLLFRPSSCDDLEG